MTKKTPPTKVRAVFSKVRDQEGIAGLMALLDTDAAIEALSAEQIINLLDEIAGQQSPANAGFEKRVLRVALRHGGLNYLHDAKFSSVLKDAESENKILWRNSKENVNERISVAYRRLASKHPDFFKIRKILHRASDVILEDAGFLPVPPLWEMRLKAKLFPAPKPFEERVVLVAPQSDRAPELDVFFDRTKAAIAALPDFVRSFADEQGLEVMVAERLSHIDPGYSGRSEIGVAGRNSDSPSKGVFVSEKRRVGWPMLAAFMHDGQWLDIETYEDQSDLEMTGAHEIVHALDDLLHTLSRYFTPLLDAFQKDYAEIDTRSLGSEDMDILMHFLPQSKGGRHENLEKVRREVIAETGAEQILGRSGETVSAYYKRTAPVMKSILETLGYVYAVCPKPGQLPRLNLLAQRMAPGQKPSMA